MTALKGKTALVTGGGRGLGRAMALELGRCGAHVIVNYLRDQHSAEDCVAEIAAEGGSATAAQADVGSADAVDRLVEAATSHTGRIDILVNNAGSILRPGAWNEQSDEDMVETINMHLLGPIRLVRALAPGMVNAGYGRVINITSTFALTGAAPVLAYTAAKAGIISMTYAMARELGSSGVTVNAIAPGNFDTAMTDAAGSAVKEWAISTTPLGRLGDPTEVAQALAFLVSADFVTGHVLVVDGGQLLNM